MIRRIVEHNKLNGVLFSTFEFLLVSAAAIFVGIGFGLHQRWIGVALAAGTALNSLVVVAFGVGSWRRGERGSSLRELSRAKYREALRREHPAMLKDTLALTAATVLPYYLLGAVAVERLRESS